MPGKILFHIKCLIPPKWLLTATFVVICDDFSQLCLLWQACAHAFVSPFARGEELGTRGAETRFSGVCQLSFLSLANVQKQRCHVRVTRWCCGRDCAGSVAGGKTSPKEGCGGSYWACAKVLQILSLFCSSIFIKREVVCFLPGQQTDTAYSILGGIQKCLR